MGKAAGETMNVPGYGKLEWHNASEWIDLLGNSVCSRLPDAVRIQMSPLGQKMALQACGTEIRFRLTEDEVKIKIKLANGEESGAEARLAEVYHGCFPEQQLRILNEPEAEIVVRKPANLDLLKTIATKEQHAFRPELTRILLPKGAIVSFVRAEGETTPPEPGDVPAIRWLAYGSSITYGASAGLPSSCYAKQAADRLGMDLINLGFPGCALLEREVAEYIAARDDWDMVTLELGINVIWDVERNAPVPVSVFQQMLDRFLPVIAQRHPDKWIFCIDMFTMQGDFTGDELVRSYREAVRAKTAELDLPRLVHLDGKTLLPAGRDLSSDLIHPSDRGMAQIADRLSAAVRAHRA